MMKSVFLRILAVTLVLFVFPLAGKSSGKAYDVRDPDDCLLNFSILSDIHVIGTNLMRYKVFNNALQDVEKNRSGHDAIVFLGDSTMSGTTEENMLFHGTCALLLRNETVLPVVGNHDVGNGKGDYQRLQNRWYDYTKAFFGKDLNTPYYYDVIDSYYFIVLGTEAQTVSAIQVSEIQLQWLQGVLDKAVESGKPAFVFSHFPIRAAVDETGSRTASLFDLLAAYGKKHDIFVFVGHLHRPLNLLRSFENAAFPETYLPSLTKLYGERSNEPHDDTGTGLEVEVYENEIAIRGRDFYRGKWYYDSENNAMCEVTYQLKNPISD